MEQLIAKESTYIRFFDVRNPADIQVYKQIDEDPEVDKWMHEEPINTDAAIKAHLTDLEGQLVFAVCDKETSEIAGWVQFAVEEDQHANQFSEHVKKQLAEHKIYYEVSFARLGSNVQSAKRGLVSSAVRQACLVVLDQYKKFSGENGKCAITAYTNPDNSASQRVLEKSCFEQIDTIYYDDVNMDVKDLVWVLNQAKLADYFGEDVNLPVGLDTTIKQFFELNSQLY